MSKSTPTPDPELEKAMKEAAESVEQHRRQQDLPPDATTEQTAAPTERSPSAPKAGGGSASASGTDGNVADAARGLSQAQKELEAQLEKSKKDIADLKDKWLRAAADLENYRKRSSREREEAVRFGNEKLLRELVPVFDDLDRTLEVVQSSSADASVATLVDGLKLVHKKFLTQLEKSGVETFASAGQPFDPSLHEAVQQVHSDQVPAGAVAQEIRRGFNLNGRLLRPALVAVSLGKKS